MNPALHTSRQVDLEILERELAAADRRAQSAGAPLAELARLVGHDALATKEQAPDDVLAELEELFRSTAIAPTPAGEALPLPLPVTEFPVANVVPARPDPVAVEPAPQPQHVASQPEDPLADDILRALEAEMAKPAMASQPVIDDRHFERVLAEFAAASGHRPAVPEAGSSGAMAAAPMLVPHAQASRVSEAGLPEADREPVTPPASLEPARRPRGLLLAGSVLGVAVIGLASLFALSGGGARTAPAGGAAPVIAAPAGAAKERPSRPGGIEVPHQDRAVLQAGASPPPTTAQAAPRTEQPLDLSQTPRSPRQIPGVTPLSTTNLGSAPAPAPVAQAPTPVTPRVVTSVPVVITPAGPTVVEMEKPAATPPAAEPVAPSPPAVVSLAPPPPPPAMPRPAPTPAVAPAPPVAAAPQPTAAPPSQSMNAVSPSAAPESVSRTATAEPRRVRTTPIRPATDRPLVPSEPESAPLRITPSPQRQAALASPPPPARASENRGGGGGFAVQLAAEGSQDAAQARFDQARSRFGALAGREATIRTAEVNGRTVYRVRVGGLDQAEANRICASIRGQGGSCFVARN